MTTAETLREWFGVQPSGGRIAATLLLGGGRVVSHADLCSAAGVTRKSLVNQLKLLRAAMDPDSVGNVVGEGFYLTEAGLTDCRAALVDAERRAAA